MPAPMPSQPQLILPFLEVLEASGGRASAGDVADRLATRVGLDPEVREETVEAGVRGEVNAWDRHVRWTRQRAAFQGLVASAERGVWEITDKGRDRLMGVRPGIVLRVFETELGVALWAEIESALAHIEHGIVNLVMTSPPYPLLRKKEYGNLDAQSYVDWMVDVASGLYDTLAEDGSLVLNLGDVWQKGSPTMSLYQERLLLRLVDDVGFHLAERFYWSNPSKMPGPAQWVTIERVRCTPSVEMCYHLSKNERCKANNRAVLRPYSESMQRVIAAGGQSRQVRPSGYVMGEGAFAADNGGSIAHSLIVAPNTRSNDRYARMCREHGLAQHPARFPAELPDFFIRYLTDAGDVVLDPFHGSGQTAAVAERLGRRWIGVEKALTYLQGSTFRFDEGQAAGFKNLIQVAA